MQDIIKYTHRNKMQSSQGKRQQKYDCFAVFLTTTDIEFETLFGLFYWKQLYMSDAGYYYYETTVERDGQKLRLIMTRQNKMGMVAAARTTTNILWGFVPQYVVMVGIMAGIKTKHHDDLALGDVVVANKIWDCSSGKFVSDDMAPIHFDRVGFWPKKNSVTLSNSTIKAVEEAIKDKNFDCPVHIGPIACSISVIAHEIILNKQVISQSKETLGLDMESYGVAYACDSKDKFIASPIIIKGISDFATSEKSYDFQKYAALNSAKFAKFLIENYLPIWH